MFVGMGANGAGGGYNLENSLRFRSSASAYLNRTPATAGNRKTWTWSGWVKRGTLSSFQDLFLAKTNSNSDFSIRVGNDDTFIVRQRTSAVLDYSASTSAVLRDPSAWYHIIVAFDTTQSISSDRIKVYVNGQSVSLSGSYPLLNTNYPVNNTIEHQIGADTNASRYLDGYLTEVNFVDGQALTASDFGDYNATTGVWQPKEYTGTYGTNGFYLPMNQSVEVSGATYLVIAGGGGGASGGGGGGAGGYLTSTTSLIKDNVYTITVGAGGARGTSNGNGGNGSNSVLSGSGITTITAVGGAGGGGRNLAGRSGGSGSGSGISSTGRSGGAGTSGQGRNGGNNYAPRWFGAGGGGGAGAVGSVGATNKGGNGGNGLASSITGSSVTRAGGGGGGHFNTNTTAPGGSGGGGTGGGATAGSGTVNTGGGGGGARAENYVGGAGGSGVVILRVATANYTGITTGSPTVTTTGSDTVIQFNASGTYTA